MYWDWGFGGLGLLGILGNVLCLGLIVVVVVLLVRAFNKPGPPPVHRSSAEQILAERFARGEIDDAEYQARLRTLRGLPPAP